MVANIEQSVDGRAAFFSGRGEPGWHNLGTVIEGLATLDEAMSLSHTGGWDVRKEPVIYNGKEVPGLFVTSRINPFTNEREAIWTVGSKYKPHQNEEAFAFTENIINLGGANWDTMGSLDNGKRVFGTLVIPQEFVLDPKGASDRVKTYLGVATSHDGTLPITSFMTGIRVVCQNTLTMALAGNQRTYKVRHTKNAEGRLEDARQALRVSYAYFGELEQEARALYETAITNRKFDEIVKTLWPIPDEVVKDGKVSNQGAITRAKNTGDYVSTLYREAGTLDNIRGTAWGAFNALTEYFDWYRPTRGDSGDLNLLKAQMGLNESDTDKATALSVVRELAGVTR